MSGADVMQVLTIVHQIQELYNVSCLPPCKTILTGGDFNDIAHRIDECWTSSAIVEFLAEKRGWLSKGE